MTIEYKISSNGQRIDTFPRGILGVKAFIDYFDHLKNDKKVKPSSIEIFYFKDVSDFDISFRESRLITEGYQKLKTFGTIKATIFVCETNIAYGVGRMLKTFHQITNSSHQIIIVKSKNEIEDGIQSLS